MRSETARALQEIANSLTQLGNAIHQVANDVDMEMQDMHSMIEYSIAETNRNKNKMSDMCKAIVSTFSAFID